jgi:hypothetical protein
MLKEKRHKNAHRKRIAAVRLDLDDPGGFNAGSWNRTQILWKSFAIVLVLAAVIIVLNDVGWDNVTSKISGFVQGVGKGAKDTVSDMSSTATANPAAELDEMAAIQDGTTPDSDQVVYTFYPVGSGEAISRIQLAIETGNVGLITEALEMVDEAKRIDPNVTGIDFIKANILNTAEKYDRARQHYILAQQEDSTRYLATYQLGLLELETEHYATAVPLLRKIRMLKPSDVKTAMRHSYALRMTGQAQEGLFEAQAAARLSPGVRSIETTAALAAIQAGSYTPDTNIQPLLTSDKTDETASPFDLIIAAGWEHSRGNTARAEKLRATVRTYTATMPSLGELITDPVFIVAAEKKSEPSTPEPAGVNTAKATPDSTTELLESFPDTTDPADREISEDIPAPEMNLPSFESL